MWRAESEWRVAESRELRGAEVLSGEMQSVWRGAESEWRGAKELSGKVQSVSG